MARSVLIVCVLVFVTSCRGEDNSFQGCLRQDSISCVQKHVFRRIRGIFSQDTINLLGGFQLVKDNVGRSFEDNSVEEKLFGESTVTERQALLEDYAFNRIINFLNERKLRWGLTPALDQVASSARMAVDNIPKDLKDRLSNFVFEGRGKKKVLKSLLPVLILMKMKLISLMSLAYVTIGVIAKKALIASSIAIAITVYIALKKLLAKHHAPVYYELPSEPLSSPSLSHLERSGWTPAWTTYEYYDDDDPESMTTSHRLAYKSHKL